MSFFLNSYFNNNLSRARLLKI